MLVIPEPLLAGLSTSPAQAELPSQQMLYLMKTSYPQSLTQFPGFQVESNTKHLITLLSSPLKMSTLLKIPPVLPQMKLPQAHPMILIKILLLSLILRKSMNYQTLKGSTQVLSIEAFPEKLEELKGRILQDQTQNHQEILILEGKQEVQEPLGPQSTQTVQLLIPKTSQESQDVPADYSTITEQRPL